MPRRSVFVAAVQPTVSAIAVTMIGIAAACAAHAAPLIVNGGFESGFVAWTRANQPGSDGTFSLQSGTSSPVNGNPVPPPPEGVEAAMSDAEGPGSHVLYQDFVVPLASALLSFDLFIGNRAGQFFTPNPATLDFGTPMLNQQARVDILRGGSDPFSVATADVLLNLYQTKPGDALVSGYSLHTDDLTALFAMHAGETLRLRFAETDNVSTFQLGVDNVRINVGSVPEPTSMLLFGVALAALLASRLGTRSARAWS